MANFPLNGFDMMLSAAHSCDFTLDFLFHLRANQTICNPVLLVQTSF